MALREGIRVGFSFYIGGGGEGVYATVMSAKMHGIQMSVTYVTKRRCHVCPNRSDGMLVADWIADGRLMCYSRITAYGRKLT